MITNALPRTERDARIALAVTYRAAALFGWNDTIYNHFTCRVPGEPECFLVKRHAHLFDEVTASSLMKVHMRGKALSFEDDVGPAAFAIHTAILGSRPDVNAMMHLHTPAGIALSARPEGFQFLNQEAAFFYDRISYYRFKGIEERADEIDQIAEALAPLHHTLILRNHGIAVAGQSVQAAFVRMQYLMMSAQAQMLANSASTPPDALDPELCAFTRDQFESQERGSGFLPEMRALHRLVDRRSPGYDD